MFFRFFTISTAALSLSSCDETVLNEAPVEITFEEPITFRTTESYVDLPDLGCPGGEFLAILPLFSPDITDRSTLSRRLDRISYATNSYPTDWGTASFTTEQTSLQREVLDAWNAFRQYLAASDRTSVGNFDELSEITRDGLVGLQEQTIPLPAVSIEAVADDLVQAGIISAAAQAPVGCGPSENIGTFARYPSDPRTQPGNLIPFLRSALDQALLAGSGEDRYSISEVSRSNVNAFGLPQSFQSVVFQVRAPSEVLTSERSRWIQTNIVIQTLGYSSTEQSLLLNIFADDAQTAAKTIRDSPPTTFEFDGERLEPEIAVRVSAIFQ